MRLKYCPYGKCFWYENATVDTDGNEFRLFALFSYSTKVCTLELTTTESGYQKAVMIYYGGFSITTQKHIAAFVREMNEMLNVSFDRFSVIKSVCASRHVNLPVRCESPSIGDYTVCDIKNGRWYAVKGGKVVFET